MNKLKTLLLLTMATLLSGCYRDHNPCCDPSPRPYCYPQPSNQEGCCDDTGYCSRPYLWEHY